MKVKLKVLYFFYLLAVKSRFTTKRALYPSQERGRARFIKTHKHTHSYIIPETGQGAEVSSLRSVYLFMCKTMDLPKLQVPLHENVLLSRMWSVREGGSWEKLAKTRKKWSSFGQFYNNNFFPKLNFK